MAKVDREIWGDIRNYHQIVMDKAENSEGGWWKRHATGRWDRDRARVTTLWRGASYFGGRVVAGALLVVMEPLATSPHYSTTTLRYQADALGGALLWGGTQSETAPELVLPKDLGKLAVAEPAHRQPVHHYLLLENLEKCAAYEPSNGGFI
jgi:hypothetical protein